MGLEGINLKSCVSSSMTIRALHHCASGEVMKLSKRKFDFHVGSSGVPVLSLAGLWRAGLHCRDDGSIKRFRVRECRHPGMMSRRVVSKNRGTARPSHEVCRTHRLSVQAWTAGDLEKMNATGSPMSITLPTSIFAVQPGNIQR